MPLSERREPTEREDTLEAVDTERSSCGTAFSARAGVAQGSGEELRSGGGVGIESMMGRQGSRDLGCRGCVQTRESEVVVLWCKHALWSCKRAVRPVL
jgi:proline racemase